MMAERNSLVERRFIISLLVGLLMLKGNNEEKTKAERWTERATGRPAARQADKKAALARAEAHLYFNKEPPPQPRKAPSRSPDPIPISTSSSSFHR